MPRPTIERMHEALDYDPVSGMLFWKHWAGAPCGTGRAAGALRTHSKGYVVVTLDGSRMLAHRLIWAMMTGEWPAFQVDHEDRNRQNNTWKNLRRATNSQNRANSRLYSSNTSGTKGVMFLPRSQKWGAKIRFENKVVSLGSFDTKERAIAARLAAADRIHGDFKGQNS